MTKSYTKFLILIVCILQYSCKRSGQPELRSSNNTHPQHSMGVVTDQAMVVSARKEASKIGTEIMKSGGNAFDAMIATEMALAVAYPFAGNLGGGGFMVYRKSNGETGALDYREKAPLAATKDMYLDDDKNPIPEKSQLGALAVGVPGTIAGIFEVHKKFGSLPFKDITQPCSQISTKRVCYYEKTRKTF